jgi:hypothetical protein
VMSRGAFTAYLSFDANLFCIIRLPALLPPRIDKQPNQTGISLRMDGRTVVRRYLGNDLVTGQSRRQFLRLKIGGYKNERIVMRHCIWRGAWS